MFIVCLIILCNLFNICHFRLPVTASPIRQLCWPTAGNLVGVVWDPDRKSDTIVEFSLTTDNEEGMVTVEIQ